MKQELKLFGITIIIGIAFYLMGAFGSSSFDISTWYEEARWVIASSWFIVSGAVIGFIVENKD